MNLPKQLPQRYAVCPRLLWRGGEFIEAAAFVVDDGSLRWVGDAANIPAEIAPSDVFDLPENAVVPGFVDAHHHLAQSLGGPYAFGEPSEIFKRVWVPLEGALSEDELRASVRHAAWQSQRGGFSAVADAGSRAAHSVDVIAEEVRAAGLRTVLSLICHDVGESAPTSRRVVAAAEKHLALYEHDPWVRPSIAVAVAEMATPQTLTALAALCREAGAILQIHVNEHLASVERSLLATGRRPLEYLASVGAVGPWLLASHATLLTPAERHLLGDAGAAWSYNPVASAWKGNAVADALSMLAAGVRTGLGTDGTRSDGFRLMDAAETAQRLTSAMVVGDPFAGSGTAWLRAATSGGADAVGLGSITGSIEPGMAADFLTIHIDVPEMVPLVDPAWQLVRLGNRDLVHCVVTGGQVRMRAGIPTWSSPESLIQQAQQGASAVSRRAGLAPRRPL